MYDWRTTYYDTSYDAYAAAVAAVAAASQQQPLQVNNSNNNTNTTATITLAAADANNLLNNDEYIYVYNLDENADNEFYNGKQIFRY